MRPSKYRKIYSTKRLEDYLKECKDKYEKAVVQENLEKGYRMYKSRLRVKIPSYEGYAKFLGVHKDTLINWAKTNEEFSRALSTILEIQKQTLIERGLEGTYNPTLAKFLLSANHGLRESTDVTSDGQPIGSFNDDQINRIAERIAKRSAGNGDTPGA